MRARLPRASVGAALLVAGCGVASTNTGAWRPGDPVVVVQQAEMRDPTLTESSGIASSRRYPGVLWTHNDTGHPALVYATDSSGHALGQWAVSGAASIDWEDLALGPCPSGTCLYIGDVGDNAERRPAVVLYRVPEPDPNVPADETEPAAALVVRYPDQPRDVEALFVDGDTTVYLVSKGRSDGIFLYRVPPAGWGVDTVTAELVDSLPIPRQQAAGRVVTGAAISTDQSAVVVRTYRDLYFFRRQPDGTLVPAPAPNRCEVLGLEPQGEAVDWWDDSTMVVTSEGGGGAHSSVRLIRCGGAGITGAGASPATAPR